MIRPIFVFSDDEVIVKEAWCPTGELVALAG
jgi:hypothetical protein